MWEPVKSTGTVTVQHGGTTESQVMQRHDRLQSTCALYCQGIIWLAKYEAKTVQPHVASEKLRIVLIGLAAAIIAGQIISHCRALQSITVSIAVT